MDNQKQIRWEWRFENFEKSFLVLKKYIDAPIKTDLERAGIIHLFEMTFELSWKVLKDYLEAEGFMVKSPRETLKKAFQHELIEDGHSWMDALAGRNLTTYIYDENMMKKLVKDIKGKYFPLIEKMYNKLVKER